MAIIRNYYIPDRNDYLSKPQMDIGSCVVEFAKVPSYCNPEYGVIDWQPMTGILIKYLPSECYVGFIKNQDKTCKIIDENIKYYVKYRNMIKHQPRKNKKNQFQKWIKRKFKGVN